mgnify:CR=1 FL=1
MNNFNGERLKLARIYRNMTASELAEKIGVTRQAVLQYEKNENNPKLDTEFTIITTLHFPRDFFYKDNLYDVPVENTFFRALSSTKKIDLQTQEEKTKIIVYIYEFLNNYFNYPELDLPEIDTDIDLNNKENIESKEDSKWLLYRRETVVPWGAFGDRGYDLRRGRISVKGKQRYYVKEQYVPVEISAVVQQKCGGTGLYLGRDGESRCMVYGQSAGEKCPDRGTEEFPQM